MSSAPQRPQDILQAASSATSAASAASPRQRRESLRILRELKAVVLDEPRYARYCAQMAELGLEPLSRAQLVALTVDYVFGAQGPLARALPHYQPREGQISLAHHVADAMSSGQILMVEAGTGTGKTFSYLVPPIIAGRHILVSTGTKALQDQLTHKDIPALVKMLHLPHYHHMALKGQTNYVCRFRAEVHEQLLSQHGLTRLPTWIAHEATQIDMARSEASFGQINFMVKEELRPFLTCDGRECKRESDKCPYAERKKDFIKTIAAPQSAPPQSASSSSSHARSQASYQGSPQTSSLVEQRLKLRAPKAHHDASQDAPCGDNADTAAPAAPTLEPEQQDLSYLAYEPYHWPEIDGEHCFIFAARYEAKKRPMVAINHALFCGALCQLNGFFSGALKGAGGPEALLPWPDVLVIDEAHTLPDIARNFFTQRLDLLELCDDVTQDLNKACHDAQGNLSLETFNGPLSTLELLVRTLQLGLSLYPNDKRNLLDLKYRHLQYPSVFELLGGCLVHPKERGLLGEDSRLRSVLASLDSSVDLSAKFFAGAWNAHQGSLVLEGATLMERPTRLTDEEQAAMAQALRQHYALVVQQYQARLRARGISPQPKPTWQQDSAELEVLVPPSNQPLADGYYDEQGLPQREPFFLALMSDLWLTLQNLAQLVSDQLEASDKLNDVLTSLRDGCSLLQDFMNCDRNKQGVPQFDYAAWVEPHGKGEQRSYELVLCPLDVGKILGEKLRGLRDNGTTIIFTSATITVNQSFAKFCHDVGLAQDEVTTALVPSPFDYERNTCLLASPQFPDTSERGRMALCLDMIAAAIECVDGGVFFLTTSYTMLQAAATELKARFGHERTVLVQGSEPTAQLMTKFRQDGQAILVGTSSFWEGVDVPGKALSLVIIDKLPFKSIGDPLQVALNDLCVHRGGSYFNDILLPDAIIMLRQGVGRLIRTEHDTGALIIMDPRLRRKKYGASFFNSLPPMQQVSTVNALTDFLTKLKQRR